MRGMKPVRVSRIMIEVREVCSDGWQDDDDGLRRLN
jgi:hypothetical protein